jgi:PhzF family phenazine biosynthesis protein
MRLALHQVDAFTSKVFGGNPAAVVPLDSWLPDATMQSIALENNLSETAFFVRESSGYRIRWFTPTSEVPLCGHATLASAWVLFHVLGVEGDVVELHSLSGPLRVTRVDDQLALDFPAYPLADYGGPRDAIEALGKPPIQTLGRESLLFAVYESEADVRAIAPDFGMLLRSGMKALVTAPASAQGGGDFVSRFFAPTVGIDEDPVTGSAHCSLIPYWSARLSKTKLRARQVSLRGGELDCELRGDRVSIAGRAVRYLEGTIHIPDGEV